MALYRRVCLLFLSIISAVFICRGEVAGEEMVYHSTLRCAFEISMEKGHLSGLMIAKENDDSIIGSMINEFGVSALSFSYDKRRDKLKLHEVVSFLDKWYIKRVLRNDLTLCLHVLFELPYENSRNYTILLENGSSTIINPKRHIRYMFHPFEDTENEIAE